ncbi:MAG: aminotransferase DegT [Sulfurimonas sp. RIFCSPHIGHO2_12_FULL_36_9]|uniref:DegT/DnrJ/EryC1/StrS family aminotransferase n=1 Tax=Sulfurimonas sp. RIFCSPLOWO2_12_36_12 TaxID=1802253 RepID=UPI0008C3833B|nr:DegT/DnrJ/EryC1/StrS family aminotransferase [Sulfurimonas sp. RIFCSPLOWO2_12_36_12]OHD98454.1 MAG: aminotransferase DegT [Sulfurimonas sp. RIFCSPHIGHO2_12_FULL_36_9]OHE00576.1 MAG: aminotransferase DegT [Sulfurimonas sp. RIFCSPLOWO2_02_FULL_36_28]OHE00754.1 MAG: aminotransferase DegT [Sulfurimonas sp. RIFCSPLOWO2_12_36_12]OHE08215.1 MAG: aminotransferase DegT [Sulfurimonas sp. RIFCSPLOWO2_12_FULL_36_74]
MKINFIDLQAQYKKYEKEINSEVLEVFASAQFIGGEKLNSLEKNLAVYTGAKHAIGCSSGTDALLLALMALDVGVGDEVITTPFTFIATAEVVALLGAKSVFVDIDEESYNIDPSKIEAAITKKTKAIIPVSLYGQCADMKAINDIAKKHNITVIEDACQSFGATYRGKKSCNLSTISCTSFFPSKPLGAYGDGGAIFTDNDELATKMRMLLNHGQNERYKHKYIGINGRLDAVQAAILNVKLKHFEEEVRLRDEIGSRYSDLLEDADVITPNIADGNTSVYAQYSIRVKNREAMVEKLSALGVPTAVHYPVPLHMQEAFKDLGYNIGDFPISELVSKEIMSLPMSAYLSEAEQDFVVQAIKG